MNQNDFLSSIAFDKRTLEMFRYLMNKSYIRVVNYHNTDPVDAPRFEREIRSFAEHFSPVSIADIDRFWDDGFDTAFSQRRRPGYEDAGDVPQPGQRRLHPGGELP